MLQKLDAIQQMIVSLLSRTGEFRRLALAVSPDLEFSDQAVSILRQFVTSGGRNIVL
jgi:hypothetical protein